MLAQKYRDRAEFEAGPPDGCHTCYTWAPNWFSGGWGWAHITIEDGDHMCRHSCHKEPEWNGLIAYA